MNWPKASLLLIAAVVFVISGCATYKRQGVKIGALDSYESKASVKFFKNASSPSARCFVGELPLLTSFRELMLF